MAVKTHSKYFVHQHEFSQQELTMTNNHELSQETDDGELAEHMDVPPPYDYMLSASMM